MGANESRQILGKTKSVRELLGGVKYSIDYYQREYRWQEKHIVELVNDLTSCFLANFEDHHTRNQVASYGCYFLGSIIISQRNGGNFIIDGQQRLTSLTLLLIYLNNLQRNTESKVKINDLVFSEKYGEKSFNICVDDRIKCMEAIYEDCEFDENDQTESVQNILARYDDIKTCFPDELKDKALPYFIDWLIETVHLVEIVAFKDEDAYTIFETMNDRGLSLTPTEMLKGYLLANIEDLAKKSHCNELWRKRVEKLNHLGKEEDADFIKAWLRGQYAKTIRERKKGAEAKDFDRIGTEFHRWVRDNEFLIELSDQMGFIRFIEDDFAFYSKWYEAIRKASRELKEGMEHIFYNAQIGFTQQYQVLLATLTKQDSEQTILSKLQAVAIYLDIFLNRRMWNFRDNGYSTLSYSMFQLMLGIRHKPLSELATILHQKLDEEAETFVNSREPYHLHGMNRKHIKQILARMTDHLEKQSNLSSDYLNYVTLRGKKRYEVEHIWANHPERHQDEFEHNIDFDKHRNLIGGLLLLPKQFNASYGDLPYKKKLKHYFGQNILAKSLHPNAYEHNPNFKRFVETSGLAFKPYEEFKKDDLLERQRLYEKLAEQVWNPELLMEILE
jgi:uncharacterized protein with ParB-like and HNH nuclease domain